MMTEVQDKVVKNQESKQDNPQKKIKSAHDRYFHAVFSDTRVINDFFNAHLPKHILSKIDLQSLSLQKESFVDNELKLLISDALFLTKISGKPGYLYVIIEHFSKPHPLIPLRVMKYMFSIMEQHTKSHETHVLPIVYPVILYQGHKAYPYSTQFLNLFEESERKLAKNSLLEPFQLVDVTQTKPEVLEKHLWSGMVEMVMKYAFEREMLPIVTDHVVYLQQIEQADGRDFIIQSLTYLLRKGNTEDVDAFTKKASEALFDDETREAIMGTAAQQLIEKGRTEGIEKGRTEGIEKGRVEGMEKSLKRTALKMLGRKMDIQSISDITDLPIEEIKKLQKSSNESQFNS